MFKDRIDAAHQLAKQLTPYKNAQAVIVAIPRGGVAIGVPLAQELQLPLDIILVKKIGAPAHEELAIGATDLQEYIINPAYENLPDYGTYIKHKLIELRAILEKRLREYRAVCPPKSWKDKTLILVDDGVATGQTMKLAIQRARKEGAKKIVIALPVCSREAYEELKDECDEIYCVTIPDYFIGVSKWYEEFEQVDDSEAIALLEKVGK